MKSCGSPYSIIMNMITGGKRSAYSGRIRKGSGTQRDKKGSVFSGDDVIMI